MSPPEWLVALDDDHDPGNEVGPCYDGPRDAPIWALKVATVPDADDWGLKTLADGLTYDAALQMARDLGYEGLPIGYLGPGNLPEGIVISGGDFKSGSIAVGALALAGIAGALAPFITAYSAELGRRFGGTAADWASKIHKHRRSDGKTDLAVKIGDAVTILEVENSFPDEARLALIDLDLKDGAVRGHRLKWDGQAGAWVSTDKVS